LKRHVSDYLPTIIVVHRRENRSKCSVEPLRGRNEFIFWTYPDDGPESLAGYVRLGIGGPVLTTADRHSGLLVIDGTWRLAERMEKKYAHLPVRSLPPCQTAYPRVSKVFDDPATGLATIEAIHLAYHLLGRNTATLLDHYRWRDEYLQTNAELLQQNPLSELAKISAD
jgi:pre-rRNA-processing protein TSR3